MHIKVNSFAPAPRAEIRDLPVHARNFVAHEDIGDIACAVRGQVRDHLDGITDSARRAAQAAQMKRQASRYF